MNRWTKIGIFIFSSNIIMILGIESIIWTVNYSNQVAIVSSTNFLNIIYVIMYSILCLFLLFIQRNLYIVYAINFMKEINFK